MNFVVMGATAGLGRALAEELAADGHSLLLVARDERDLAAEAAHVHVKYGVEVHTLAVDLAARGDSESQTGPALVFARACELFRQTHGLFFPIGVSRDDDSGQLGDDATRSLLEANLTGVISTVSHFLPQMPPASVIVGFGSIASCRGRSNNVVYAAAKRALESYFESLRHLTCDRNIRVHFWRIGYLDTSQTFGKPLKLPPASPRAAAREVLANLDRDRGLVHYPHYWTFICAVLRLLPWWLFRKLRF